MLSNDTGRLTMAAAKHGNEDDDVDYFMWILILKARSEATEMLL